MLQNKLGLIVIFISNLIVFSYSTTYSLDGIWTLENNSNSSIKVAGKVPGGIYSDLSNAGILGDIFYRDNDLDYRWVSKEDWTYYQSFQVTDDVLSKENIFLVLHGVDTVASIHVNNVLVSTCDNMFVRYRFPVKSHLQVGENTIKVIFQSPITAATERFEQQAQLYEVPPLCVPPKYQGECHVNHLRKMQASFSWDWGPAFPSAGLWKSVELEAYNTLIIRDITSTLIESETDWDLQLDVFMEAGLNGEAIDGSLEAKIQMDETSVIMAILNDTFAPNTEGECNSRISITVPKDQVLLWWPNGYGSQQLYNVTVIFTGNDLVTSQQQITIGFRAIELIQDQVATSNSSGLSFYFKVNHVPVFSKGSNWIPSHILPELSYDYATLYRLLNAAKIVNMNMLRVWGGGLYESHLFYKIADEMGILIWQDLMFACSMYPASPEFLASVSTEVRQQVRQLQHHPSIAVWAGNNENEAALHDNWYGTASNFDVFKADYVKLYVDTIRPIVNAEDTSRSYLVSSPSNGIRSEEEGYISDNPYSPLYGDLHYYNYLSDGWDANIYPRSRFISEYGFQSMPSLHTLGPVSVPTDLHVTSEFSQRRQHHPAGYEEITAQISRHMTLPPDAADVEGFPAFIYLSQINQAMSTKTETETYRRNRYLLTSNGEGQTMGALYWQLNDIWQAPSWASVEYGGRWKMLHYFAKDFFDNILVTGHSTVDGLVNVHLVSDLLTDISGVTLSVQVFHWDSLTVAHTREINLDLPSASANNAATLNEMDLLSAAGCGQDNSAKLKCFLYFSVFNSEGNKLCPDNFLFLGPLHSAIDLQNATVSITDVSGPTPDGDSWQFQVTVTTNHIALFVWLEAYSTSGYFSYNGFVMVTTSKQVIFHTSEELTSEQLQQSLTVISLTDS